MCFLKLFRRNKNKTVAEPVQAVSDTVEKDVRSAALTAAPVAVQGPAAAEAAVRESGGIFIPVRYNRSFTAKLIQADGRQKDYYGEIKNELMRYGVKTRTSWRYETFKTGRKLLAKIAFRGKTTGLYLALDPKAYVGTKYKLEDVSSVAANAGVPSLYKIKNDRRCKYSKELIAAVMEANGLTAGETPTDDYAARYPYEELEPLIERNLVKLLKAGQAGDGEGLIEITQEKYERLTAAAAGRPQYPEIVESITVAEAETKIADEVAETFIMESGRVSDRSKRDIVNIDVLGKYFDAGESVTVEEIKKRVPSVNRKATCIKVLARGTLDKALNVEADDFSPAAVKMIVLTGGTVTRMKKSN